MRRLLVLFLMGLLLAPICQAQNTATLEIRGKKLTVYEYGRRGGPSVVLSSGDLGWAGLVTHVAEFLAEKGYFVVGISTRTYLSTFTERNSTLTPSQVAQDYASFVRYASEGSTNKTLLAGTSEGAGLSVLVASTPDVKDKLQGVLALGLPNVNELGWRWTDFTIWVTKHVPDEPTFMAETYIDKLSPVALAEIHSTHDEFLPLPQARRLFAQASNPKKMWEVEASNHRFSNNRTGLDRTLSEAIEWIRKPN